MVMLTSHDVSSLPMGKMMRKLNFPRMSGFAAAGQEKNNVSYSPDPGSGIDGKLGCLSYQLAGLDG